MPHMMFRDGVPGTLSWASGRAAEMIMSHQKAKQAMMPKERALENFMVTVLRRAAVLSSRFEPCLR